MAVDAAVCAELTYGRWVGTPPACWRGATLDSRKIRPGQLFVAMRGAQRDGHEFLGEVWERGAAAALVEKADPKLALPQLEVENVGRALQTLGRAWRRAFSGPVIALTGSCGKTTTKNLLARLLAGNGENIHATEGNYNNLLGVPLTLLGLDPEKHDKAVIETGINQPGEMLLLARMIEPTEVILTSVEPVHLERLETLDNIAREKLFLGHQGGGAVLLTAPENVAEYVAVQTYPGEVFLVGTGEQSKAPFLWKWNRTTEGKRFLAWEDRRPGLAERGEMPLPRVSRGMVANIALALAVARRHGVSGEACRERLKGWEPEGMRGEIRSFGGRCIYLDCYNANPAAMIDALEFFQCDLAAGPEARLYIMGTMGELGAQSADWHKRAMAAVEIRAGDQYRLIGEEGEVMREALMGRGVEQAACQVVAEAGDLRREVGNFSGPVFLKGSRRYRLEEALPQEEKVKALEEGLAC